MALGKKLDERSAEDVRAFKELIAPWAHSYGRVVVSLVAFLENEKWVLYAGRVALGPLPVIPKRVSTDRLLAIREEFSFDEIELQEFIDRIFGGRLAFGSVEIDFVSRDSGSKPFGTSFTPYDNGPIVQVRSSVLRIFGQNFENLQNKSDIDLALMAGVQPYSSLSELLGDFGVSDNGGAGGYLEIVGNVPAVVDLDSSSLRDGRALLVLKCLRDLDASKIQIGVQEFRQGNITRSAISGEGAQWDTEDGFLWGRLVVDAPKADVLRLFVSYAGNILNHCWIGDPLRSPNLRRAVHHCFDPMLETARDMLLKEPERRQDSREFEVAVGWLFWMLGFSPISWVGSKRLTDAPDLVLQSANGRIYVVEATTGTLRVENKLPNLIERTERIRSAFSRQGVQPSVTPVLCTSLDADSIVADLDHAAGLGIVVLNGRHLENFLDRTLVYPDSDLVATEFDAMIESRKRVGGATNV